MSEPYVPSLQHPRMEAKHSKVAKILATTNPEQLTTERRLFVGATVTGKKGDSNTDNTDVVYLGWDSTVQPVAINPGQSISIQADQNGLPNNLEKIWLKGSVGDGVVVNFIEGAIVS